MAATKNTARDVRGGAKKQSAGKRKGKKTRPRRRDLDSSLSDPLLGAILFIDLSNPNLPNRAQIIAKINNFISDEDMRNILICFGRHPLT